jgi:RimJ/RimL family protein N-acetyltransferase
MTVPVPDLQHPDDAWFATAAVGGTNTSSFQTQTSAPVVGGMLDEAWVLGLDRVLAVCAVDNVASMKTMERCGGVFEGIRDTQFCPLRRYWFEH